MAIEGRGTREGGRVLTSRGAAPIYISALRGKKGVYLSPRTLALTSFVTQYVTKQSTTTAIYATIILHGMTHSKEFVDSYYRLGMGIRYSNVLLLRDVWTMHDLELCWFVQTR